MNVQNRVGLVSSAALAVVLLLPLACGGGDDPAGPGGDSRMLKPNPSFAADIREIFTRRGCTASSCHGQAASAGLALGTNPFGNLVNVPSTEVPALMRVRPGDVANSYLVIKLEGTDPRLVQARMPLGQAPLDAIDLGNIRNWIANGAPNN